MRNRPVKAGIAAVALGILAIIAIFALLLIFSGNEEAMGNATYNGFTFEEIEGIWVTEWQIENQTHQLYFRHHPEEVRKVPVRGSTDARFQKPTVYLTIDPSENRSSENAYLVLAAIEMSSKLTFPLDRYVIAACTENSSLCSDRPIVTCSGTDSAVIYLKQDEEAGVIMDGNCVTVQGSGEEVVKASDKLLFQLLGIMS